MATMKTNKITCILALVLGMVSSASADEIVVWEWIGHPLDIPDNGEYATSFWVSSAPRGAHVTGVAYEVLVDDRGTPDDFWCSDYEIGLSSTARGGTGNYLLVWDNEGSLVIQGGGTDANADDDPEDDSDIDLSRSTAAFNGQAVNQMWYFSVKDNVGRHWSLETGLGCLKKVKLTIQYEAEPFHFHDPNLKAAVETQLGVTNPTPSDMLLLTELDAENKGISDLTGLEYAVNLAWLNLKANQLTDLSPLAGLTNLSRLYLSDNQISDLRPLAGLTNLETLDISANQINNISPMKGLTNLTGILLSNNQISDISPLAGLTNLVILWLDYNHIQDITSLKGLTNLFWLHLDVNKISDISPLAGLTNLGFLGLGSNQISDISPLAGLTNLLGLRLSNNQISDISTLAHLAIRFTLYLQANPLNPEACSIYIPQIRINNPGITIYCDPCPPTKPTVGALGTDSITATSAILFGMITDDGGEACQYQFRYRKAGGSYTYTEWTGSVRAGEWIFHSLTGLDQNSTYDFAARAKNLSFGEGDWPATDMTFTTLYIIPPTVTTEAACDITGTAATLQGRIDDDGNEVCEYQFEYYIPTTFYIIGEEYSHSTSYQGRVQTGEHFSSRVIGLDPNRTYYFTVRARNSAGEGDSSLELSFTTPVIKATVTTLPATRVTPREARLNGKLTQDGGNSCQYRFRYKRGADGNYEYTSWTGHKHTGSSLYEDVGGLTQDATYYFAVQVRNNSVGESDWGTEQTFTTVPLPEITDVRGTHFTKNIDVYFLDGIDLNEEVTVGVEWNGLPPGKVIWKRTCLEGEPPPPIEDNCPGNEVSRTFNVGSNIGDGCRLSVYAISENRWCSASKLANFRVISQPPMEEGMELSPVSYRRYIRDVWTLRYESGLVPLKIFDDSSGNFGYTIPDWVPMFGGYGVRHLLRVRDKMTVWPQGQLCTASEQYYIDMADYEFAGKAIDLDIGLFKQSYYDEYWFTNASLSESCKARYPIWYFPITICGIGIKVEVGTAVDLYNQYSLGSPWTGTVKIDPKIYAKAGCDVGLASLKATGKGGLKFHVWYPQYEASKAQLEKFCIDMSIVVKGSIGTWKFKKTGSWESPPWRWCPVDKSESVASYVSFASSDLGETFLSIDGGKWELMARDYLGADYAVWLPPAPDERRGKAALTTLVGPSETQVGSVKEQVLQANIFENSQPTLATDKGELLMAWVYDDPSRSSANRSEVVFSRSDGGTWTPPVPIWDDGTADMSPQLAVLPSGQVLCVWENANRLLSDDEELDDMASALEIAVASYDSETGLWSTNPLTSDSHLDRTPQIVTAANNTAFVVWVYNEKDDILGVDPNATDTIRYCFWNGSTWSQPGTAATGIGSTLKTALAYNGTRAVYAYTIDTDGDPLTDGDRELYALVYDGSGWSRPIRLTNDNVADVNPQVVFDGEGEVLLVWYREGSIVSCRNLNIGTLQQVFQPDGVGARNFRLVKGPAGHISLVWTSSSTKSEGIDIVSATYDPLLGVWSNVYQLTSDIDEEVALTAAYVDSDELALAYDKGRIRTDAEGDEETYRTDLCVLRHKLVSDLAVLTEDISVTPTNPRPGDTVNIKAVIHNIGSFAEADVHVGFYYGDPADTGYGGRIGDVQVIKGPIVAGGTGEATVSWTIPDTNNLQQVYVVVDPPSHSDHDVASIQVLVPDLTVDSVQWEKTANNVRRITASIANQGVGSSHNVGATIRMDSPRGQELHGFTFPVINAGSSREVSWGWDISGIDFNDPEIVLCVVVDEDQKIQESDEQNNTGMCVLHVSKAADLTDDGSVDVEDLAMLSENWLKLNQGEESDWQPDCDLNHDGQIDLKDFSILGKDWNWAARWHTE